MALILLKSEIKVPLCPYCYRYKITLFPRICLILKWKSRVVAYEQFSFLLWVSENLRNFALQAALKPRSRGWGRGCDIMKSVYPRWFLTPWNSRKISHRSQGLSNGRCPWICNYLAFGMVFREEYDRMIWLHLQAWASALPSDFDRQCEKPQGVGW